MTSRSRLRWLLLLPLLLFALPRFAADEPPAHAEAQVEHAEAGDHGGLAVFAVPAARVAVEARRQGAQRQHGREIERVVRERGQDGRA